MAVLRNERDGLADVIGEYVQGRFDSFVLDERLDEVLDFKDKGLCAVWTLLWGTYDDFRQSHCPTNPVLIARMRRCYAFLRSDLEYDPLLAKGFWTFTSKPVITPSWPFRTQASWLEHRHLAGNFSPNTTALMAIEARRMVASTARR